jgi:polyamine oxidase
LRKDWEYAYPPEQSSQEFGIVNYNTTFYQFSEENNYVFDSRGFNAFIKGEAASFLKPNDPRLLLNTVVTNITHNDDGLTVHTRNGTCIKAAYAICTFSLGVLQNDDVAFDPLLPQWKRTAIETFQMGTYTKIFLQFPHVFWPEDTQFLLYADPNTRGYYPVWQSLDTPGFLPGSGILFATVVDQQSYRAERMTDAAVQEEVLKVLYSMFGRENVPDPIAFLMPRWSTTPWAYGSYSNWPPGMTLEMHQNLRSNVGRLWFAGEATSAEYFGFLHGAWFEGREVGEKIGLCVKEGKGDYCTGQKKYKTLHGTTNLSEYSLANGWEVSSFQTIGDV